MKEEAEKNEGMMPRIDDVATYRQYSSVLIFPFIYKNATNFYLFPLFTKISLFLYREPTRKATVSVLYLQKCHRIDHSPDLKVLNLRVGSL